MSHWSAIREHFEELEGFCVVESAAIWDVLLSHQGVGSLEGMGASGHFMEIGVYRGKTAAIMALHMEPQDERLVLIDPFAEVEATLRICERVGIARERLEPAVRFLSEDSRRIQGLPFFSQGRRQFRWIHIDGRHTGEAVYNDLQVAGALCSDRGVVVLDDFFSPAYPQITEAVFHYVRQHPYELGLFLMGYGKAYLARPEALGEWRRFCAEEMVTALESRDVATTLCKTTFGAEAGYLSLIPRSTGASSGSRVRGPDWAMETLSLDD